MAETLLDNAFLARLEYLIVAIRELFLGHVASTRMSRRFGRGVEFADHRSYAIGDDFRYLDWAVFARRGDLAIKLFTEEEANNLYFLLDASRSMSVGEPSKLLFAKKLVAALGYIGLVNLDPVTVVRFDEKLRDRSHMFQGRGKLRSLLSFLEDTEPGGRATSISATVREFLQRRTQRGLIVILSDFLDRDDYEETLRLIRHNRYELMAIQINERAELQPELGEDIELIDSESGRKMVVQTTPEMIEAYLERVRHHYAELNHLCRTLRANHVAVFNDMPFENVIFDVFRRQGFLQ
jgi:uncharacterized protein (DUF58 family)